MQCRTTYTPIRGRPESLERGARQIEEHYREIGRGHPQNYGLYRVRWHQGARRVYEAAGPQVVERLWAALRDHPDPLDEDAFIALLDEHVDRTLGDLVRNWDAETLSPPSLQFVGGE